MNYKAYFLIFFVVGTLFVTSGNGQSLNGDGVHKAKLNDIVSGSNGWNIKIVGIFLTPDGEEVQFKLYDNTGKQITSEPYIDSIKKVEGPKKIGNEDKVKLKISLLSLSGQTSPTDSALVSRPIA